jgi:hypothetical protein
MRSFFKKYGKLHACVHASSTRTGKSVLGCATQHTHGKCARNIHTYTTILALLRTRKTVKAEQCNRQRLNFGTPAYKANKRGPSAVHEKAHTTCQEIFCTHKKALCSLSNTWQDPLREKHKCLHGQMNQGMAGHIGDFSASVAHRNSEGSNGSCAAFCSSLHLA